MSVGSQTIFNNRHNHLGNAPTVSSADNKIGILLEFIKKKCLIPTL